jgi:hypothetical protein
MEGQGSRNGFANGRVIFIRDVAGQWDQFSIAVDGTDLQPLADSTDMEIVVALID